MQWNLLRVIILANFTLWLVDIASSNTINVFTVIQIILWLVIIILMFATKELFERIDSYCKENKLSRSQFLQLAIDKLSINETSPN